MTRNIINPEAVSPFLERLCDRHPDKVSYISRYVRSHILKRENTFLIQDDCIGFSLWVKKILKSTNATESSMFKNQGVWGRYFKLNLNDACFERYSHYLDFASSLECNVLEKMSFKELIIHSGKQRVKKNNKIKIQEHQDFIYMGTIQKKYTLIKLLSIEAFLNEGEEMHHCVGKMIIPQLDRDVFSLRREDGRPVMTIYLNNVDNRILEAKGFANRPAESSLLRAVEVLLNVNRRELVSCKFSFIHILPLVLSLGLMKTGFDVVEFNLSKTSNPSDEALIVFLWFIFFSIFISSLWFPFLSKDKDWK